MNTSATRKQVANEAGGKADGIMGSRPVYESGRMKLYQPDIEFPLNGAPSAEAIWSVNIVKKMVVETLKLFPLSIVRAFFSKKYLNKLLISFNRIGYGAMEPYLNYEHFNGGKLNISPVARGVGCLTELFLIYLKVEAKEAHRSAQLIAHVIEYDFFYRFKLLDLMSETSAQDLVENPRKEIQRIIMLCHEREQLIPTYIRPKLEILHKLSWILALPKLKNAVKYAVLNTNMSYFDIEEADYYWMLLREDYHYFGRSPKENKKVMEAKGWKLPKYVKV